MVGIYCMREEAIFIFFKGGRVGLYSFVCYNFCLIFFNPLMLMKQTLSLLTDKKKKNSWVPKSRF